MHLERALVTGAGGVPLPAPAVSCLVVVICLRWVSRLWGIPSGDTVASSTLEKDFAALRQSNVSHRAGLSPGAPPELLPPPPPVA